MFHCFAVGVFVVIAFAGLIEILPNFAEASRPVVGLKPYTVLELAGKEVYKKDACIACHSQMIRQEQVRIFTVSVITVQQTGMRTTCGNLQM